jgi:hypothetical protein
VDVLLLTGHVLTQLVLLLLMGHVRTMMVVRTMVVVVVMPTVIKATMMMSVEGFGNQVADW